jgi:hypothetical protein
MPHNSNNSKNYAGPNYQIKSENPKRTTQIKFFQRHSEAVSETKSLIDISKEVDLLYVAIKQENLAAKVIFTDLPKNIKVYFGEAWYLIHKRRVEENYY